MARVPPALLGARVATIPARVADFHPRFPPCGESIASATSRSVLFSKFLEHRRGIGIPESRRRAKLGHTVSIVTRARPSEEER